MNEPAYPIFFPTYTPIPTGYARDWWWYDPEVDPEDSGPFETRSEAVADWAMEHYCAALIQDMQDLDRALGSPMLQVPAAKLQAVPVLAELRRGLLETQALAESSLDIVIELDAYSDSESAYRYLEVGA
jgi:hypothetical protein